MRTLQTALQNDASKPALCHTFGWDGTVRETFTLELNHPMTPGIPALFVGKTYARRNNYGGCIYRPNDDGSTARVRRATVREVPSGDIRLYFLCEPDSGNHPQLVYMTLEPPKGVKVKMRFYVNASTNGKMIASSDNEFLLALKSGERADVLLADGRVVRLACNGTVVVERLPIEQQANIRIAMTKGLLEKVSRLNGGNRVKAEDYALHQLISIVEAIAPHSETIRTSLSRDLRTMAKSVGFRPSVSERFEQVMNRLTPRSAKPVEKPAPRESVMEAALNAALKKKNGTK